MTIKIAINGFGRIGRAAFKIAQDKGDVEVVAINDLASARVLAHLLKYDSAYGRYEKEVAVIEDGILVETEGKTLGDDHFVDSSAKETLLMVGGKKIKVFSEKDPEKLPWKEEKVDVVLECTGRFTRDGAAKAHLKAGAKKVVVSAPAKGKGDVKTYLLGANSQDYKDEDVVSNASCTTNCVSPIASVMVAKFGVEKALMTTIHAVTAEQNLVDGPPPALHEDLRRGRSALANMVPTSTGAAKATGKAVSELEGIFDGIAIRVPILVGSLTDFTFLLKKEVTVEEVNKTFLEAIKNPLYKGVIDVTYEPITSTDIVGDSHSAIVDLSQTKVVGGNLVKVLAWYDNEWGYSNRLVEISQMLGKSPR